MNTRNISMYDQQYHDSLIDSEILDEVKKEQNAESM